MKLMLMTDVEGVAGVLNPKDWIYPVSRYYEQAKQFLTEETNAAVEGFLSGGFTEIIVVDGHGCGAINPALLHKEAKLLRGPAYPVWPFGLDNSFDAYAVVGQHAKSRTPYSHISHTGSFNVLSMSVNGYEFGEYGEMCFCAAELKVPTIFASGEKAFCAEAEEVSPGVVTVAVKEGLHPDGCDDMSAEAYENAKIGAIHLSHAKACELIKQGTSKAAELFRLEPKRFTYRPLAKPYDLILKLRSSGGKPPRTLTKHNNDSFIGLMNMPYAEEN